MGQQTEPVAKLPELGQIARHCKKETPKRHGSPESCNSCARRGPISLGELPNWVSEARKTPGTSCIGYTSPGFLLRLGRTPGRLPVLRKRSGGVTFVGMKKEPWQFGAWASEGRRLSFLMRRRVGSIARQCLFCHGRRLRSRPACAIEFTHSGGAGATGSMSPVSA